jgi:hypothetical protein
MVRKRRQPRNVAPVGNEGGDPAPAGQNYTDPHRAFPTSTGRPQFPANAGQLGSATSNALPPGAHVNPSIFFQAFLSAYSSMNAHQQNSAQGQQPVRFVQAN